MTAPDSDAGMNTAGPDDAPDFAMVCCAVGAEEAVKQEIGRQGWRLAFSRPGFVTAKNDQPADLPHGIFVRTAARSLGHLRDTDGDRQLASLTQRVAAIVEGHQPFDELHVWPRDRLPIGKFGFEPEIDQVSQALGERMQAALAGMGVTCDRFNRIAQPGARVLDIVLVDPAHWFIGEHVAGAWPSRWPGGIQPVEPRYEPISRAYYKAAEAIAWSGFEMVAGETVVEIGSAPGGACGRLLEMGMRVIGIDPAEMDPRIASHPRFRHHRARAGDLPRRTFRDAKWMLADSNVRPDKLLTTVEHIVTHRECRLSGMLLTLKLGDYAAADQIPTWCDRIGSWGVQQIEVRQLARNRCEVCVAVRLCR